MMKLELQDVRVDQTIRFVRTGSVLRGTASSGCDGVDVRVDIDSAEAPERIAALIEAAKATCFMHTTLVEPVPTEMHVRLNGRPLESPPASR